jgi:hypothetical protein
MSRRARDARVPPTTIPSRLHAVADAALSDPPIRHLPSEPPADEPDRRPCTGEVAIVRAYEPVSDLEQRLRRIYGRLSLPPIAAPDENGAP